MLLGRIVFARQCVNGSTQSSLILGAHQLPSGNSCFKLPRSSRTCVLACYNPGVSRGDEYSSKVPSLRGPPVSQSDTGYGAMRDDYEDHEIETGIHWLSLSNDEFVAQLADLRQSRPGFCESMLCEEEWTEFCKKRFAVVSKCAEEVSKMIGNTDLITPLLEYRKFQRGE